MYHRPVRTHVDVFSGVKWLPTPILDPLHSDDEQYLSFDESYTGDDPNDDAQPGQSVTKSAQYILPKPIRWKCSKQTARAILVCSDCERPRLLFAKTILTLDQNDQLKSALASLQYTCGSPLFEVGHPLETVIMQHSKTCCALNIDRKYYEIGDKLIGFQWLCAGCLDNDIANLAGEAEGYSGLPRCAFCKAAGIEPKPDKKMPSFKRKHNE